MARVRLDAVLSHWFKPIADFETPTLEFYEAVEQAVGRREMPGVTVSRIDYRERGVGSANREYLRASRERFNFDICAAPFGNGYFFSWWLTERRRWWAIFVLLGVLFGAYALRYLPPYRAVEHLLIKVLVMPFWSNPFLARTMNIIILFAIYPIALAVMARVNRQLFEDAILGIPLFGWLYAKYVRPQTYYWMDTIQAFQAGVHGAVLETVEATLAAKGARALTDDERKPVLDAFARR